MAETKSSGRNLSVIVLFGLLSVICAEVFSGSSPLWMWDWWGLLVVLPLYWGHGMILWNIALHFRRTSFTHLYLLGIIFGLYESWMTKVIWAGYFGQPPQFGQFLGFAIGEFLVIALFWHAIFSFIIPLYMVNVLGGNDIHWTKGAIVASVLIILLASLFIPLGLQFDAGATLMAVLSNAIVFLVAYVIARIRHPDGFDLESLRVGKLGWLIMGTYTLFLYGFLLVTIRPEAIAPPLTLFLTVIFYVIVIVLLFRSKEAAWHGIEVGSVATFGRGHLLLGLCAIFLLALLWVLLVPLAMVIATLMYLGMVLAGPALFLLAVYRVVTGKL